MGTRFQSNSVQRSWHRGLVAAALLATTACGGAADLSDAYDVGLGAETQSLGPLATVTVPEGEDHGWQLDTTHVRLQVFSERQVIFFDATEEPRAVEVPIPSAAKGAGHVALRSMSDGAFRMSIAFGVNGLPAVSSGGTRRRWRELMVPLSRPLAFEPGDTMTLKLESSALPVVVEAVRFMP